MIKCKYAGDIEDEYCKNCDGMYMEVDDKKIACTECAGYEAGEEVDEPTDEQPEDVSEKTEEITQIMNPPEDKTSTRATNTSKTTQKAQKQAKSTKTTNTKGATKKAKNDTNMNTTQVVKEEKKAVETINDIKVVSMRYTSSATVKKGDNYFKFTAEEEWDVSQIEDSSVDDTREILWATLNSEVDNQIEELNSMN